MRLLVTGAAGFLGSNICDRLIAEGHEVIGMDNFVTGSPDNLAHLAGDENFSFIRHDVSNFIFVPGQDRCDYAFCFTRQPKSEFTLRLFEPAHTNIKGRRFGHPQHSWIGA